MTSYYGRLNNVIETNFLYFSFVFVVLNHLFQNMMMYFERAFWRNKQKNFKL